MQTFNLNAIQKEIKNQKLSGWLFYDFNKIDPITIRILRMEKLKSAQKRWFYYVPATGIPVKIVHSMDHDFLDYLPGKKEIYFGWEELQQKLMKYLKSNARIAMQYSPKNSIPYISRIDAGTLEFLKSIKIHIVSSADLAQIFEIQLSRSHLNSHITAAKYISEILDSALEFTRQKLIEHTELTELAVQSFIINEIQKRNLVCQNLPVVAAAENTANPFYKTSEFNNSVIRPDKLLFIEIASKLNEENAVFAKISFMAFTGHDIPEKYEQKFSHIIEARDEVIKYITGGLKRRRKVKGFQVDEHIRNIMEEKDLLKYYLHKTGHSLSKQLSEDGVNLDNLETHDSRLILNSTCLAIEPGLYFSGYGFRSCISAYLYNCKMTIYTKPVQNKIYPLLSKEE